MARSVWEALRRFMEIALRMVAIVYSLAALWLGRTDTLASNTA